MRKVCSGFSKLNLMRKKIIADVFHQFFFSLLIFNRMTKGNDPSCHTLINRSELDSPSEALNGKSRTFQDLVETHTHTLTT